jgi:hypothetical protein
MRIWEAQKHRDPTFPTDPEHHRKGHFSTADLIPGADDPNDNGNIRIVVIVVSLVVVFVVVVFVLLVPGVGVAGLLSYRLLVLNPL